MAETTAPTAGSLLLIGGGRMGEALAGGLLAHGWPPARLAVVEAVPGRREELARAHPDLQVTSTVVEALDVTAPTGASPTADAGPASDQPPAAGAVIAVKPHDVVEVCRDLREAGIGRVLSIAAGVTLAAMEVALPGTPVLRAMPNTAALVGAAAAAVSPGSNADNADVAWARTVLEAIGTVVELPEPALDAVTGLSGSGPAYVFLIAEAMIDAGVLAGLARPVARQLAVQTLLGSARLLAETGEEAPALRAAVTSPGGTTAAGLRALEAAGVRSAFLDAVMAATERARELGRPH